MGRLSHSACPGVVSRPPRTNKTANPRDMPVVPWQQVKLNQQLNNYEVILGLQPREKAALLKASKQYKFSSKNLHENIV